MITIIAAAPFGEAGVILDALKQVPDTLLDTYDGRYWCIHLPVGPSEKSVTNFRSNMVFILPTYIQLGEING